MRQSEPDDHQDSGKRPWRDEDVLRELAEEQGLTQPEIADRLGCGRRTVTRWQSKFGIERYMPWRDEDLMRRLYVEEGLDQREIAEKFDVSLTTVCNWMQKHGIEARGHEWNRMMIRASYRTTKSGYEAWRSSSRKLDGQASFPVHRLAAVAWFGIDAVKGNVTHHKNGVPWDNRECNLELMSQSEHASHHDHERWSRFDSKEERLQELPGGFLKSSSNPTT